MEKLKREDIERIVNSPALTIEDIAKEIKEELDIEVDTTLDKEQIIDVVFKAYNTAVIEVEEQTQKAKVTKSKRKENRPAISPTFTRKQCIVDALEVGAYTKKEIIAEVDERFGYNLTGKSSRMRVSKVLKNLAADDLLEELADGILRLKPKGE